MSSLDVLTIVGASLVLLLAVLYARYRPDRQSLGEVDSVVTLTDARFVSAREPATALGAAGEGDVVRAFFLTLRNDSPSTLPIFARTEPLRVDFGPGSKVLLASSPEKSSREPDPGILARTDGPRVYVGLETDGLPAGATVIVFLLVAAPTSDAPRPKLEIELA